jgi:hypothetical protein
LRVSRAKVELRLGKDLASRDPHDLPHLDSAAERAAYYLLLSQAAPSYGAFMYVVHQWDDAGRSLKEWLVAQYALIIDEGSEAWQKAALYSLWVDFFEVPRRAEFVFPRLWKAVRRSSALLGASGPVPWRTKERVYREAAADPQLWAGLARGIAGSFFDVFGDVDPPAARELLGRIAVDDARLRAALTQVTTEPMRWQLVGLVFIVDERDERWTRWLHGESSGRSFLASLRPLTERRGWVPRSELVHRGAPIGRLVHYGFPFDRAIRHRVAGEVDVEGAVLFRVDGDPTSARNALGEEVESWPAGLRLGV